MLTLDLPRPQIFVSHSAHDGCARAVREAVVDCLRAEGFEVLIDEQQFSPGEAWRPRLDDWLHVCDGALVILTPEAAESRYVFYETTLLRNRARSQPDIFTFVPLRFSNVTDEMLIRHMDPLQLGEIQQVEVNVGATDMPMSAQEVMEIGRRAWEEVRELLQPAISRRQPRHMIEQLLIDLLFQHFSLASLHEMHKRLSLGGQLAGAKKDQCITLARALLDFDAVPLGPDRFDKLASVAPQMYACMGRQHAQTALNCIVPFCWVHPEAAKMLEQVASAERRAVAWGRTWNLSERMYLLRTFYDRQVIYVPVSRAIA